MVLDKFLPTEEYYIFKTVSVQEVHYSNDGVIFPDKDFLAHGFQCLIFHHILLKPSNFSGHRKHGNKNTPSLRNLIASTTDSLIPDIIFSLV